MNQTYPKNNTTREGIITNMCYTWDHAFGINKDPDSDDVLNNLMGYTAGEREFLWNNMAQIYDNDIAPFMKSVYNTNTPYTIHEPESGWKTEFTDAEKRKFRQMAETLAMLDGNAFFGMGSMNDGSEWYEQYLPEAHALYIANGGDEGWAGESSINKTNTKN